MAEQTIDPASPDADSPDEWARDTEAQMTDEERFTLLHGVMPFLGPPASFGPDAIPAAGYVRGVPRLGVVSLRETDASLGIANPFNVRPGDTATAFPSSLALGASFNLDLARKVGEQLGREARGRGFNVLLGGGCNLARDPRNGRNFEYISEDPLLSGLIAGEAVAGTQAQGVVSTVKHFALNLQETNRKTADSIIGMAAMRESDLLAFEIAIERGQPGSVMGAYNLVNGAHACGNDVLLNGVLKETWGYPGWVMSDWGAVDDWSYAVKGLDQQSGEQLDKQVWFDAPLKDAVARGDVPRSRISDMVRRILRSVKAVGADWSGPQTKPGPEEGDALALQVAREGIVLLKNDGLLPIAKDVSTIALIGGRAKTGVLSGGGSSQVTPPGGFAASAPLGGDGPMGDQRVERWFGDPPHAHLLKLAPQAEILFDAGMNPEDAAALAKRSDIAIVIVTRHEMEGFDSPNLCPSHGQNALVAEVAAANPNTVVVIEAGNPVDMPWIGAVKAVLHAWYPGQRGGQAMVEILTGVVNPSGHSPMTFPVNLAQTPRPELPGFGTPLDTDTEVKLIEGADVGYRWFAKTGAKPLFPFGHGLSYTSFAYTNLQLTGGDTIRATFTVTNTGKVAGADVAQLYLTGPRMRRLIGFARLALKPGESATATVEADPRLLADFDDAAGCWVISGGACTIALAQDAADPGITAQTTLAARRFGK